MADSYTGRIERFLDEAGATYSWSFTGGDHRRLTVELNGRRCIQIVAKTPSDPRGALNTIQDLRHQLGLVQTVKRVGTRRTYRKRAVPPPLEMPSITERPDPLAALASLRAELEEWREVPEIPPIPVGAITQRWSYP